MDSTLSSILAQLSPAQLKELISAAKDQVKDHANKPAYGQRCVVKDTTVEDLLLHPNPSNPKVPLYQSYKVDKASKAVLDADGNKIPLFLKDGVTPNLTGVGHNIINAQGKSGTVLSSTKAASMVLFDGEQSAIRIPNEFLNFEEAAASKVA
jgi:hypothetical protein